MPKNAVQRLQKIHNELKCVLSICDVVNPAGVGPFENDNSRCSHKKNVSRVRRECQEGRENERAVHFRKTASFIPRPVDFRDLETSYRKSFLQERKPGSAPTYPPTECAECEPDFPLETNARCGSAEDKYGMNPIQDIVIDCPNWLDQTQTMLMMTPSEALETANEVLAKFNEDNPSAGNSGATMLSDCSEGFESDLSSDNYNALSSRPKYYGIYKNKIENDCMPVSRSIPPPLIVAVSKSNLCRTRSASPKKETAFGKPLRMKPKSSSPPQKSGNEDEKKNLSLRRTRPETSHKIPKLEKRASVSPDDSRRTVSASRKNHEDENRESDPEKISKERTRMSVVAKDMTAKSKGTTNQNVEPGEKTRKENSRDDKKKEKHELEDQDLEMSELCKIIEKSNEKLQKMKLSKNLAIDIARQLKNKYEDIKQSKNKLLERLQKVEMDNERLNNEIRDEKDGKVKLQVKMDELKQDSNTMLLEREKKTKQTAEENEKLKELMKEMEKRFEEEMAQKQKEIEELTSNRCSGTFTDEEVAHLKSEKNKLLGKIDELSRLACDRQSRIFALEKNLRELEEEVKRQKHCLKQKTERLEDTNKELESIRQNSQDLEEQVKTLRQSIENFDQMHQKLVAKATDYESELKKRQEQIKKLEEEKAKCAAELSNEKDSLLIKNKIIEDQQETIKQMREKSEEYKNAVRKTQSLERLLNLERDEKLELKDAVEHLKWRKEELKKKVKELEGNLRVAPHEVVRDLQKTQLVLQKLENQVHIKQKEWELHLQSLIREKEQACSVAEFATKKLMQTTNEFQKQSEAHKRLHRILAENLAEKERHLKEASKQANHAQLRRLYSEVQADAERMHKMMEEENKNGDGKETETESESETESWSTWIKSLCYNSEDKLEM